MNSDDCIWCERAVGLLWLIPTLMFMGISYSLVGFILEQNNPLTFGGHLFFSGLALFFIVGTSVLLATCFAFVRYGFPERWRLF